MKLELKDKPLLFSETSVPDIFFSEYLPELPGDCLKLYLYMNFLSKFSKNVKINDLSKKLSLPLKSINECLDILEKKELILKKPSGYIILNLQDIALKKLYSPNLTASEDKIKSVAKNQSRAKAIDHINNMYFQGVMSPSWYNDIDIWFQRYGFDEQVMISLFDYCYNRSTLHKNYVQAVAEAWGNNKIKSWSDLEAYEQRQEKFSGMRNTIARKLGKRSLTEFEDSYIKQWIYDFGYDMDVIEIALKKTTSLQSPNFEYIHKTISGWHERNLKTPAEINAFNEQWKKQNKNAKALKKSVSKVNYSQRTYDNLDFLYANNSSNNA